VAGLEAEIDAIDAELPPLTTFILPGGSPGAAWLHLARTVCRRAERSMVELANIPGEHVSPHALTYINRLSDLLFVASRYINDLGKKDVLWVPGQNR
jgi:cob(I)alamin adenosyltransferase